MSRPPRRNMRVAQKRATRDRLIAAARECFASLGYAATTVEDITSAAGVTRATFYLHFTGKADLVRELVISMEQTNEPDRELLTKAVAAADPAALRAWLARALDLFELVRPLAMLLEDAEALDPSLHKVVADAFAGWVEAITAGLAYRADLDEGSRRLRGLLAYSQLDSLFYRSIRENWTVDRDEMLTVMVAMWHAAFTDAVAPPSRRTARSGRDN